MKRIILRLSAAFLAIALLGGCSGKEQPESPAATLKPEVTAAPSPTPEETPGLDYDEIRIVAHSSAMPYVFYQGYFTMSRDGLWGLMRADGTEVLPCTYEYPVSSCQFDKEWVWNDSQDPLDWDEYDALSARIEEAGDGHLCAAHGGAGDQFFYDLDSPDRNPYGVDPTALRWYASSTPGEVYPMEDSLWEKYGDLIPVYSTHPDEYGYPTTPVADDTGATYWYISREGAGITVPGATMALWFFEEDLAPVELEDGWAYLDRYGNLVTQAVYEPTWYIPNYWKGYELGYASCLQNGYATVCRDGQWGLLDANGIEVIPCENEGVAWEGTHLWVKGETGWKETPLPQSLTQTQTEYVKRMAQYLHEPVQTMADLAQTPSFVQYLLDETWEEGREDGTLAMSEEDGSYGQVKISLDRLDQTAQARFGIYCDRAYIARLYDLSPDGEVLCYPAGRPFFTVRLKDFSFSGSRVDVTLEVAPAGDGGAWDQSVTCLYTYTLGAGGALQLCGIQSVAS